MDINDFNQGVRRGLMRNWVYNEHANHGFIRREFHEGHALDMHDLGRLDNPQPAIVIGSGPSLDHIAPLLPQWQGAIFASPSHMRILDAVGRHPEYLVALDSSTDVAEKLSGIEYHRTMLITHPSIDPGVLEMWGKRPKRYFLMQENGEWSDVLPLAYPWIHSRIPNMGCVANSCIYMAHGLGYDPIFLAGVEFAFTDGKESFTRPIKKGNGWYRPGVQEEVDESKSWVFRENGVLTSSTNVFYKSILLANWKMFGMHLVTMAPGIVTELPFADPETVVKAQGQMNPEQGYLSQDEISKRADAYTIPRGMRAMGENGNAEGLEMAGMVESTIKSLAASLKANNKIFSRWKRQDDGTWTRKEPTAAKEKAPD